MPSCDRATDRKDRTVWQVVTGRQIVRIGLCGKLWQATDRKDRTVWQVVTKRQIVRIGLCGKL